jgi:hypothetical protein
MVLILWVPWNIMFNRVTAAEFLLSGSWYFGNPNALALE